jgi:hypothetical protein
MGLMSFPQGIFHVEGFLQYGIALPELWNSGQLWGIMMTTSIAMWRLSATPTGSPVWPKYPCGSDPVLLLPPGIAAHDGTDLLTSGGKSAFSYLLPVRKVLE